LVDKFHVKYEPWRKSNTEDPILFGLQPKDNWSMNELDPIDWFNDVYKKLRPITKRKFIVRPHPNNVSNILERRKELPTDIELQYTQKNFVGDEKKHYRFFCYSQFYCQRRLLHSWSPYLCYLRSCTLLASSKQGSNKNRKSRISIQDPVGK
jgi:hypothetical protein